MSTGRYPTTATILCSLIAVGTLICALEASGGTATVDGTANIYGAGHAAPPDPGGVFGGGPAIGTLPPLFSLQDRAGHVLTFPSITGTIQFNEQESHDADGNGSPSGMVLYSWDGLSGIRNDDVYGYLVGVFLAESEPTDPAPPMLDFTAGSGLGRSFATLSPLLNQTFFIGDGRTGDGTGAIQEFIIPDGATRFGLGFAESYVPHGVPGLYHDNSGTLFVHFEVIPEPATWVLLGVGCASLLGLRPRRAHN